MPVGQKIPTTTIKSSITAQNRPNSLPNNIKQLVPLKMREQSQIPNNIINDNFLQEVDFRQVYV